MSQFSGNVTLTNAHGQPSQWGASPLTAIVITLLIIILSTAFRSSSGDKIYKVEGFHILTVSKFFSQRYDFFQENFKKTGILKMFRFNLLQVSSYTHVHYYTTKNNFSYSIV